MQYEVDRTRRRKNIETKRNQIFIYQIWIKPFVWNDLACTL